jgi:hypothetical protein
LEDLDNKLVIISLDRYVELLVFEYEYNLLLNSGVDNWNYYEDVWEEYDADELREELIARMMEMNIEDVQMIDKGLIHD